MSDEYENLVAECKEEIRVFERPQARNSIALIDAVEQLQKENEESFRKGFWAGYEDARCFPDESNILQRYTALTENRNSHDK